MLIGRAARRGQRGDPEIFSCGHPRSFANLAQDGLQCGLCTRMKRYRVAIDRQIDRWRGGHLTQHERILRRLG